MEADYFGKWVHDISEEMKQVSKRWIRIGELLTGAALDGIHGKVLRRLCSKIGISYPTATKLIKIGSDHRLQAHSDRLTAIDSWATLYEIAQLNDSEFEEFKTEFLEPGRIASPTRAKVSKFRKNKQPRSKPSALFSGYLEAHQQLTPDERELLRHKWDQFETDLPQKLRLKLDQSMVQILNEVPSRDPHRLVDERR
jgi:hypothetical protein